MANEKRLIDKDALIELCDSPHWCVWMSEIEDFPTVDAVEVVHGQWIPHLESVWNLERPILCWFTCSECNTIWDAETNYCPNCGAKMDGDGNGDEM